MRGKRENTKSIGIMRIDITASCRSRVLRVSWLTLLSRRWCTIGSSVSTRCSIIACVITSSPTRLISWSTFSIETRIEDDSAPGAGAFFFLLFFLDDFLFFFGRRFDHDAGGGADLLHRLEEAVALRILAGGGRIGADFVERLEEAVALAAAAAGFSSVVSKKP
jgi:hypothetical protein